MNGLAQAIVMSAIRRALGYLGVAGVVGLDNEVFQAGSGLVAAGMFAWSVYAKIRDARKARA